jgi:hypothetical protein
MSESILNPQGLQRMIEGRRFRFQKRLTDMSRPVSFQGNFVGVGFNNYETAIKFLSVIPEDERRRKAKECLDRNIKPMFGTYVLGANFVDEFLDTCAGVGGR